MIDNEQNWWTKWREEDYSWDGLASKRWPGKCWRYGRAEPCNDSCPGTTSECQGSPEAGRPATMQDYWQAQQAYLRKDPVTGQSYTPIHLPLTWSDGTPTTAVAGTDISSEQRSAVAELLAFLHPSYHPSSRNDSRADLQLQGAVLRNFGRPWLGSFFPARFPAHPISIDISSAYICSDMDLAGDTSGALVVKGLLAERSAVAGSVDLNSRFFGPFRMSKLLIIGHLKIGELDPVASIDLSESCILGGVQVGPQEYRSEIVLSSCYIAGDVEFAGSVFNGTLALQSATIEGSLSLRRVTLNRSAILSDAHVKGDLDLLGAVINGHLECHYMRISGASDFDHVSLGNTGKISLVLSLFEGGISFSDACVKGQIDIGQVVIAKDLNCKSTVFDEGVGMNSSYVGGATLFDGSKFRRRLDISKSVFEGEFSLNLAEVGGAIDVSDSVFLADANFGAGNSGYSKHPPELEGVDAQRVVFLGKASFNNRVFSQPADLRGAVFMREAEFFGATLHQGTRLQGAKFEPALDPGGQSMFCAHERNQIDKLIHLGRYLLFGHPPYRDMLRWEWRDLVIPDGALESVSQARLALAARRGCKKTSIVQERVRVLDELDARAKAFEALPESAAVTTVDTTKSKYFASLEQSFSTLKQGMESIRNQADEARFARLGQLARRRRRDHEVSQWERWISYAYALTSDYGQSATRPPLWLLGIFAGFSCLYAPLATVPVRWPNASEFVDSTSFSAGRMLPMGPWAGQPEPCTVAGRLLNVEPKKSGGSSVIEVADCNKTSNLRASYGNLTKLGVSAIATTQSLSSLILFFVLGLAIRRRFQIG